jgi:hypothetical protein
LQALDGATLVFIFSEPKEEEEKRDIEKNELDEVKEQLQRQIHQLIKLYYFKNCSLKSQETDY